MESSMPQKFDQFMKQLFSNIAHKLKNVKINIAPKRLKCFYQIILNKEENYDPIQIYLGQLKISQTKKIQEIKSQFKDNRAIYQKYYKLKNHLDPHQKFETKYNEQDVKFQVLFCKNYIIFERFVNYLQNYNRLKINNKPQFENFLDDQLNQECTQQQSKEKIFKFLQTDQKDSYQNYQQSQIQKIVDKILSRKIAIQNLAQKLFFVKKNILQNSLNYLYTDCLIPKITEQYYQDEKKQTQEQFCSRVIELLKLQYQQDIAYKKKNEIIQELAKKLYKHFNALNQQNIKNTLKQSEIGVFKNIDKIPNELLIKIYDLENGYIFDQSNNKPFDISISNIQQSIIVTDQQKKIQQPAQANLEQTKSIFKILSPPKKVKKEQQQIIKQIDKKFRNAQTSNTSKKKQTNNSNNKRSNSQKIKNNDYQNDQNKDSSQFSYNSFRSNNELSQKQVKTIKNLKNQIQIIQLKIGNNQCFQIILRQLQIATIQKNGSNIKNLTDKIDLIIEKYKFGYEFKQNLKQIGLSPNYQKHKKAMSLKQKILPLNLVLIIQAKRQIQNSKQCESGDAIIIIGNSGAGKTTFMIGASGYQLQKNQQANGYQPIDTVIADKYVVSNTMISQTRKPNISKVRNDWVNDERILLIDTPGLMENRESQVDITNILSTIYLLKRLESARIVIILCNHQFIQKCFGQIESMIVNISAYLSKIQQFEKSITFIYSKGLTQQRVREQLKFFFDHPTTQKKLWSDNQKKFVRILKKKFIESKFKKEKQHTEFQIINPANHDYQSLINKIVDTKSVDSPGDYIQSIYTNKTIEKLNLISKYLQKMAQRSFQLCEFKLTQFYLQQIKQVQSIRSNDKLYNNIIESIKIGLEQKLQMIDLWIKKFYSRNQEKYIQNIKQVKEFCQKLESNKLLLNQIYKKQDKPLQKINRLIDNTLKQPILDLQNISQVQQKDRNDLNLSLKLISELMPNKHSNIITKIENNNMMIENNLHQALQSINLDLQQNCWTNVVDSYLKRFKREGNVINDKDRYKDLLKIIQKYFDNKPEQQTQIFLFLNNNIKKSTMNGNLAKVCNQFLEKLNKLKATHFIIRQFVQPKINHILQQLEKANTYFQNQRQNTINNFDDQLFYKLQIYDKNSDEILKILVKNFKPQRHIFQNQKIQQSALIMIRQKLQSKIQNLKNLIDQLPSQPEKIDPQTLINYFQVIFRMMNFIKKKKQSPQDPNIKNSDNHIQVLDKLLKQSEQFLHQIKRKIAKATIYAQVEKFQLNYKLILCLLITIQFGGLYLKYDKSQKQLAQLAITIKQKIMQPLQKIKSLKYNKHYFQKLLKSLRYLSKLDKFSIDLGSKAEQYNFNISFKSNKQINQIIAAAFKKILQQSHSVQLKIIKQLINHTKTIQNNKKEEKKYIHQRQVNLNSLNTDLSDKAATYIVCFDQIKNICAQFYEHDNVSEFINENFKNHDLQQLIQKRIDQIKEIIQSTAQNRNLTINQLFEIEQQFKFYTKVLKTAKRQQKTEQADIRRQLNELINTKSHNFVSKIQVAQKQFKSVIQDNTQLIKFQKLQVLLDSQEFSDQKHKKRIISLIISIQDQYIKFFNQLSIYFDQIKQIQKNANIIIDIKFFFKMVKNKYQKCIASQIIKDSCIKICMQLKNSYKCLIDQYKSGKKYQKEQAKQLQIIENKIRSNLGQQYSAFKQKENNSKTLESWFVQQTEIIKRETQKTIFSDSYIVDKKFKQIFQNTSEQKRLHMKTKIKQNNIKQVQKLEKLLESDHKLLDKSLEQMQSRFQNFPQQLLLDYKKAYNNIKKKKQEFEENIKTKVSNSPDVILEQYIKGKSMNNKNIMNFTQIGVQKFYDQQRRNYNFDTLQTVIEVLKNEKKFCNNSKYQQLSKSDKFIQSLHQQFLIQIQTEAKNKNKQLKKELSNFKNQLNQLNFDENFKLQSFIYVKPNMTETTKTIQFYIRHKQYFVKQSQQLINQIQTQINQKNIQLKQCNAKLNQFSQNLIQKKKNIQKIELICLLKQVKFCQEICTQYKNVFDKNKEIIVKADYNQIVNTNKIIDNIKIILRQKYNIIQKWDIEQALRKDTPAKLKVRFNQIQGDLALLQVAAPIFFGKKDKEIPQNILQSIQKQKQISLRNFQKKVSDQIYESFNHLQQVQTQRVTKFYTLKNLLQTSQMKIFPIKMNLNPQIQHQLRNAFKTNIKNIQQFSNNKQKQSIFKNYMQKYPQILVQANKRQKCKAIQFEQENIKIEQNYQLNIVDRNKSVLQNDQQKLTKLKNIKAELDSDKITKQNDLKTKQKKYKQQLQIWSFNQKQKLNKQINIFLKQICLLLINNKRARMKFKCQEYIINNKITIEALLTTIETNYSKKISRHLYNCLRQYENTYSYKIIEQQKMFSIFTKLVFLDQAKGQNFQSLLKSVPQLFNNQKKQKLMLKKYQKYTLKYDELLKRSLKSNNFNESKNILIDDTKRLGLQLKRQYQNNDSGGVQRHIMLAYIFAVWTIIKAQQDDSNNYIYTQRPHGGQILCVFLLLQFDSSEISNQISKTMVQVSTGQGKSVILGALSAYLALAGFQVFEACYSLYLSMRDYSCFQYFFDCLGLSSKITYNIFPEICKMMLDQSPAKPFTKKVYELIFNHQSQKISYLHKFVNFFKSMLPQQKNNYVLLIDEADVFVDEKYIGQNYVPSINIKNQAVTNLLDFVWSKKELGQFKLTSNMIISSDEFQKVIRQIENPIFKIIMQNQTHAMIRGLFNFKDDPYIVIDNKIQYKQGDGLSNKIHYGYRTIFAYYNQCYNTKRININELNNQAVLNLTIASFSYAMLPSYFNTILGVTGTLAAMSHGQKQILMRNFGVKKTYIQPSIYPTSNRTVKFQRCNNKVLFNEIVKDIDIQYSLDRPIVIFFKTKSQVYSFFESKEFQKYRTDSSNLVTYQLCKQERDYRINCSTMAKKITLLTFDFSRGTDFKLSVKDPKKHPGLHVISAFLPTSYSDYIQLVGRTGRQGKNGSATIYIVQDDQVKRQNALVPIEEALKNIHQKDKTYWELKFKQINQKIQISNKLHEEFVNIYSQQSNTDTIFQKIRILNHQIPLTMYLSKTAICIDATASMNDVFPKLIQVIQGAIPDIYEVIQKNKLKASFQIKFVVYRNYDSRSQSVLQFSNFQTKSTNLVQWLNTIQVTGGWGNEAIQICLEHLNSLKQLNQFIIIADAQANTKQETIYKRNDIHGQKYWQQNGFKLTNYDSQLQKLIQRNIKGHSYYIKTKQSNPKMFFEKMSKKTGGRSQQFCINKQEATKKFADFVSQQIINNLSDTMKIDEDGKANLLESYKQISKKRYKY